MKFKTQKKVVQGKDGTIIYTVDSSEWDEFVANIIRNQGAVEWYMEKPFRWLKEHLNVGYEANGIGFKEQGYSGTQTDLSCGSNHALSPDGSTLIIPKPGDGTFSCLNYTILRYPN